MPLAPKAKPAPGHGAQKKFYWQQSAAAAPTSAPPDLLLELEQELLRGTKGVYQPAELRRRRRGPVQPLPRCQASTAEGRLRETPGLRLADPCEVGGRVSVVSPTTETRQDLHAQLYACFAAQDWPDKELIVVETTRTGAPSPFFSELEDERVVFVSYALPERDWSIGLKRNVCLHLASGDWVAAFDDDDLYAPNYLSDMLGEMARQRAAAITLGGWFVYEELSGRTGYVDPRGMDGLEEKTRFTMGGIVTTVAKKDRDEWLYGFGFSFVYSRRWAVTWPFPDRGLGEDYEFFSRMKERLPTALLFDDYGLCLHTLHARSTSSCEGCEVHREALGDLDVAALGPLLEGYLARSAHHRGVSRCFTRGLSPSRKRTVQLYTSQGAVEVLRPHGCTVLELRKLAAPQLGVPASDLAIYEEGADSALPDAAPVTLRMRRLCGWLPIDNCGPQEVAVSCSDAMEAALVLEVRVMSDVRMGQLREALLAQHLAAAPKDRLRRLRLAKPVGNSFVGVDASQPLGETRNVSVMGLAECLAAAGKA